MVFFKVYDTFHPTDLHSFPLPKEENVQSELSPLVPFFLLRREGVNSFPVSLPGSRPAGEDLIRANDLLSLWA